MPTETRTVRALAVEAWQRAAAMGLVEPDATRLDDDDVRRLVGRVRETGIARGAAWHFDNVDAPSVAELETLLRLVVAALEASPVPAYEWPAVSRVLEPEPLASLLNISVTSLRRYLSGERDTPDEVAARLHHVALIVGDLAGAYNDVGVRRWFTRPRSALDGQPPRALLAGDWAPEDSGPQRVRALARSLTALGGT